MIVITSKQFDVVYEGPFWVNGEKMTIRNEEIIRDKLNFYKDRNEAVHLVLQYNYMKVVRPFRNGKSVKINEENVEFDDEVLGTILIYFHEIINVMKREVKR